MTMNRIAATNARTATRSTERSPARQRTARLAAALLAACGASAPAMGQVQVFMEETSFFAATSARPASGPLPNIGKIIGSQKVGTVTFSALPGGVNIFIGAKGELISGDWYEGTPGHDIALNVENLRVEMEVPVFSAGFHMVEPNLTMPPWGVTPIDTVFNVELFLGAVRVGSFSFNVDDDVPDAFVGVWSASAFDVIEIRDGNQSNDDEYWGDWFTGSQPMCYADCDGSIELNIDDFVCFQTSFAIGDSYADCDASGQLNIDDFICFQTFFALGC